MNMIVKRAVMVVAEAVVAAPRDGDLAHLLDLEDRGKSSCYLHFYLYFVHLPTLRLPVLVLRVDVVAHLPVIALALPLVVVLALLRLEEDVTLDHHREEEAGLNLINVGHYVPHSSDWSHRARRSPNRRYRSPDRSRRSPDRSRRSPPRRRSPSRRSPSPRRRSKSPPPAASDKCALSTFFHSSSYCQNQEALTFSAICGRPRFVRYGSKARCIRCRASEAARKVR